MLPGALGLGISVVVTFSETTPLRGMFTYLADAPLFEDCATGRKLPVAMEADYLSLERAYLEKRRSPGEPLLASVEGRIEERVNMEGPARPTLVVERFLGFSPGETCEEAEAHPFQGTYWKLTELNGTAVVPGERRPEAHLVFQPEGRMAGSDGCNRMFGSYTMDGERIRFSKMGGTLMACREPARDRELIAALEKAAKWRITGAHLDLLSAEDELLARFEAAAKK
ncbi:MAG TPA: META domain-containing protein [Vicinamibacteria bacterium]|nr:META domain-containing protein [Vicinamibacteria bacterium]